MTGSSIERNGFRAAKNWFSAAFPLLIIPALALLQGCNLPTRNPAPQITRHPLPELTISTEFYLSTDCRDEVYYRTCAEASPLGSLGCSQIYAPLNLLGGLQPAHPMVLCQLPPESGEMERDEYLFNAGCSLPQYMRYAIQKDGELVALRNPTDMAGIYAPIETPAEALSYAVAITGLTPLQADMLTPGLRYLAKNMEETVVVEEGDAYHMNLVDAFLCGCGPHTVELVPVSVLRSGEVKMGEPVPLYQDPEMDNLCID